MATPTGVVSDPHVLGAARRLRALSWTLESALFAVIVGSVTAIGAVHPWAYVPLWCVCLGTGTVLVLRAGAIRALRRLIGCRRFAFHPSARWLALDAEPSYGLVGWSFDLARPVLPRPPLLVPGLAFGAWVLLQLVPLPPSLVELLSFRGTRTGVIGASSAAWHPLTVSERDTLRGLAFLGSAMLLHLAAAAAFGTREARGRFRRVLAGLGLGLALVALAQLATGARRIYGVFEPLEGQGITVFGPFVNRNHFAGYMLLVVPMCLSLLGRAYLNYARHVGEHPNVRRRLVGFSSPEGIALIYASIPALATVAALLATTSRGGLIAFAASLTLAGVGVRKRSDVPAWVLILVVSGVALSWFGLERLGERFARAPGDAPGRVVVWRDSLERMEGLWLTGSGFNTFAAAMSRATPWVLPVGATPWPDPLQAALSLGSRPGFRAPSGIPGVAWYREAHNDYLQLLVETGIPGLALGLWGAVAALRAARSDPWLLAAVAGVLMHVLVDFDLQIPAIAMLFVAVAGTAKIRSSSP